MGDAGCRAIKFRAVNLAEISTVKKYANLFAQVSYIGPSWSSCFILFLAHLSQRLKVSYCDHSSSVLVVRLSVRPFTIFKQHLLLNH